MAVHDRKAANDLAIREGPRARFRFARGRRQDEELKLPDISPHRSGYCLLERGPQFRPSKETRMDEFTCADSAVARCLCYQHSSPAH